MKRYLLFGGEDYYPGGGWRDFLGDFDSEADAEYEARRRRTLKWTEGRIEWAQVVDVETGEVDDLVLGMPEVRPEPEEYDPQVHLPDPVRQQYEMDEEGRPRHVGRPTGVNWIGGGE